MQNYLKGFDSFINEMASTLITGEYTGMKPPSELKGAELKAWKQNLRQKYGVPEKLARAIHTLSGGLFHKSSEYKGDAVGAGKDSSSREYYTRIQMNDKRRGVASPAGGGNWPERQDIPVAHDVGAIGQKTGKRNIENYLINHVSKREDTGLQVLIVNPTTKEFFYITRKTGKISQKEVRDRGWTNPRYHGPRGRDEARRHGISNKRGNYMRSVANIPVQPEDTKPEEIITLAIDGETSQPMAQWEGTIGQMASKWDDQTVLFVFDDKSVLDKRGTRENYVRVDNDQFLDYLMHNFDKVIKKFKQLQKTNKQSKFSKVQSEITPANMTEKTKELEQLQKDIMKDEKTDVAILKPELVRFLQKAKANGKYQTFDEMLRGERTQGEYPVDIPVTKRRSSAGNFDILTDMVEKHSWFGVAYMFVFFYLTKELPDSKLYTGDAAKILGLDTLLGSNDDFDDDDDW